MQSDTLLGTERREIGEAALKTQANEKNKLRVLPATLVLPPTPPEALTKLRETRLAEMQKQQVPVYTEHVIHAGMYLRTITIPPHVRLTAVFVKIPTVLIVVGNCEVLIGNELTTIDGYAVLPARGGRQQEFTTGECPVILTMAFATKARTVEEAEQQFTDETDLLLSRRQNFNSVTITGE